MFGGNEFSCSKRRKLVTIGTSVYKEQKGMSSIRAACPKSSGHGKTANRTSDKR